MLKIALSTLCENPLRKTGLTSLFHELVRHSVAQFDDIAWIVFAGPSHEWALEHERVSVVREFPANDEIRRRLAADHFFLPGVTRHRPADRAALVRLIASAELFIANNSGPMHLAFALGRPTVVVNGPTMRVWDPCWHPERMLMLRDRTLPCLPCDSYHGPVETCKNAAAPFTCLLRWTTDEVERACRQWLDRWATPCTH